MAGTVLSDPQAHTIAPRRTARFWAATLIIVATFILNCIRAFRHPLWMDEMLTFYTANQPSLHQLLHFQSTTPIVLEPPLFEVLAHCFGAPFHYATLPLRLVSLLSVVVLQLCLYRIVQPVGGTRAALLAMIGMAWIPAMSYGFELRPYALLMAASAAALFCWQQAVLNPRNRNLSLAGLVVSLAAAITCQFYGFLVLAPICAGELHRWIKQRKIDAAVAGAIAVGFCSVVLDIPFWKATVPFKQHMQPDTGLGPKTIAFAYKYLLLPYDRFEFEFWPHQPRRMFVYSVLLTAAILAVLYAAYKRFRSASRGAYTPLGTALAVLTALPFVCVTFACLYTHTFHPRHCVEAAVGAVALIAIALASPLERVSSMWAAALLVAFAAVTFLHLRPHWESPPISDTAVVYKLPPSVQQWLNSDPEHMLYADVDSCIAMVEFANPAIFSRIRCIYSRDRELRFTHNQITYLTEMYMEEHTSFGLQFVSFEDFQRHLPAVLLYQSFEWQKWIPDSIGEEGDHAQVLDNAPVDMSRGTYYLIAPPTSIASAR